MTFKRIFGCAWFMVLAGCAGLPVEKPSQTPAPSTPEASGLIEEGIALHDQGKYDEALQKFEEVLKSSPDNVEALYEMAFTHFNRQDYARSMEIARKGARYYSRHLAMFYMMIGNSLDHLGRSREAIRIYAEGLKLSPDHFLLYFNMGVTYHRMGDLGHAREAYKRGAVCNPRHPGSQYALAQIYHTEGLQVPAVLALSRALILEPDSSRTATGLSWMAEWLRSDARKDPDKPMEIQVNLQPAADSREGDYKSSELFLGLSAALRMSDEKKDLPLPVWTAELLGSLFSTLKEDPGAKGFAQTYYNPYFIVMKERNFVEPFCYYIHQSTDLPGVREWLKKNPDRVRAFLDWSNAFRWRAPEAYEPR